MAGPNKADLEDRARELGIDVTDEDTKATLTDKIAEAEAARDGDGDGDGSQHDLTGDEAAAAHGDDPAGQEAALGTDLGYVGDKVDPRPNSAYSQESDPTTSPSALDAITPVEDVED